MLTRTLGAGSVVALLVLALATPALAALFELNLPDVPCAPPLPYVAIEDGQSGAACVQMVRNTCPNVSNRGHHSLAAIQASINLHKTEPTWFSDPDGIEGTLEDPGFSPCGTWSSYKLTDKSELLGKILWWMKVKRYLTPVCVGNNEHWVTIYGYTTDPEPTSTTSPVNLIQIRYYDPMPGFGSVGFANYNGWLTQAEHWGGPISGTGTAFDGKYLAVIEPPDVTIPIVVQEWIWQGPILPIDDILPRVHRWLEELRLPEVPDGPLEPLRRRIRVEKPILVDAGRYQYYLVPFEDTRMAAVVNAYTGEVEEFRCFVNPQPRFAESRGFNERLREAVRAHGARVIRPPTPKLRYNPETSIVGRTSPSWVAEVVVSDAFGREHTVSVDVNLRGNIVRGLEKLPTRPVLPGRVFTPTRPIR